MQLNEILEENSVKAVSQKTNIAEDNIDALAAAEFDKLKRVKTMGFISILEREYNADLSKLKEQAMEYYNQQTEVEPVTIGLPLPEEKKGKSKWFIMIVILLIIYAVWYGFTHLDKEKLSAMLPFSEESLSKLVMPDKKNEINDVKDLSIEHVQAQSLGPQTNDNETNSNTTTSAY